MSSVSDARIQAPVALDDRGLERQLPELGHLDLNLAGLGVQLAAVMARAVVLALVRALVAPGLAQLLRLGVEQIVDGLLDRAANDPV